MAGIGQWIRNVFATRERARGEEETPRPRPGTPGPGTLAAGNNAFALALYARLRQRPGNLFCSPFSIRAALGMAYAGAAGATAREMAATLFFPLVDDTLHGELGALIAHLNSAGGDLYELAVANSLWAQEGSPMRAEFAALCATHYRGGLFGVDFQHAAEAARQRINGWVEERTHRRIRDLVPPDGVDELTRLVIANAVYFKGKWASPFEAEWTQDEPFFLAAGGSVTAKLMRQTRSFGYVAARGFQVLDLPYLGGDLSMTVLLPEKPQGLERLERELAPQLLYDCLGGMESVRLHVVLPRFKVTWGTYDASATLAEMGMATAVDRARADFSRINGALPPSRDALYVGAVFHQAFVDTTEEGTEAAAATAAGLLCGAGPMGRPRPIPIFRADHPFLFAIRDRASGTILFLGRVADPTQEH